MPPKLALPLRRNKPNGISVDSTVFAALMLVTKRHRYRQCHVDSKRPHLCTLIIIMLSRLNLCLQCFDAVGWTAGRESGVYKLEWWGVGMVICLERDADLHMAQLMPLPLTVSCFSKIQIGFTFLVPAHSGSPGKRAVKRVCVCQD